MATQAPAGPRAGERIFLVDGNNLVHRLFHATPPSFAPADGTTPINAVVAWTRRMRALRLRYDPHYLVPIFDGPGDNWRRELYPEYKAKRRPSPAELDSQWEPIWRVSEALGLSPVRQASLEADDLLGAYTEAAVAAQLEVVVVSNDKDLMQLIRGPDRGPGSVRQLNPFSGRSFGPAQVEAKFGVPPALLADLLALAGDSTDNIPGVPGIGPKIAASLIRDWGDLAGVLANASLVRQTKRSQSLLRNADSARLSRKLVALRSDRPLPRALADIPRWTPSRRALDAFFGELGFASFELALDGFQPRE
ncbi:DNA polymerase I [Enhygromyxa salina]|uniref:DNA polymerase I n=1 Tax=Enhygromyxa salina TaxID=215803 RepID=A0A2S9XLR1_9BACT|nr:5'-3' exonuclease H3TH domain-containing protein [Enhygromyxa salina]PRP93793.1 DNA polymerase I [Enhygromyxa salina]